jgi:Calcineurin-like phosphoesterase
LYGLALLVCLLLPAAQQTTSAQQLSAQALSAQPQETLLNAWVEMVGKETNPAQTSVRAVTTSDTCPSATVDGQPFELHIRKAKSDHFPVTTCEGFPPAGARHVVIGDRRLALAPAKLRRIVILGDTGCRMKGKKMQRCNDPQEWPFRTIAQHAAEKHPDLVIHVGDYYYRETGCPLGDLRCVGSPHGDLWPSWSVELFVPAKPLLEAAPWIFVRGNHEQCGRGASGWFRFLDASATALDCKTVKTSAPYTVRLDGLNLHVVDSADTDDLNPMPGLVAMFSDQLQGLGSAVNDGPGWILTHRPIWGIDPTTDGVDNPSDRTEQVAADALKLPGVDMIVSGHVHMFTALSYGPARPVQLIVGDGGTDPNVAWSGDRIRQEPVDGMTAHIYEVQRYGYTVMDRVKGGWRAKVYAVDDSVMAQCRFHGREATCKLAPSVLTAAASGKALPQ